MVFITSWLTSPLFALDWDAAWNHESFLQLVNMHIDLLRNNLRPSLGVYSYNNEHKDANNADNNTPSLLSTPANAMIIENCNYRAEKRILLPGSSKPDNNVQ
jgi:hypothetical protein